MPPGEISGIKHPEIRTVLDYFYCVGTRKFQNVTVLLECFICTFNTL